MICSNPYLGDSPHQTLHKALGGELALDHHEYLEVRGQQLLTLRNLNKIAPFQLVNQQILAGPDHALSCGL
jgi:hypothetical protein